MYLNNSLPLGHVTEGEGVVKEEVCVWGGGGGGLHGHGDLGRMATR